MFPKIVGFPPKSSILIGFSIIFTIHFGVPLFLDFNDRTWYNITQISWHWWHFEWHFLWFLWKTRDPCKKDPCWNHHVEDVLCNSVVKSPIYQLKTRFLCFFLHRFVLHVKHITTGEAIKTIPQNAMSIYELWNPGPDQFFQHDSECKKK